MFLGGKWLKNRSLAFKLSVSVVGIVFLGIAVLLGVVTEYSKTIVKSRILEQADDMVWASAENIDHLVDEVEQVVRVMKNALGQLDTKDERALKVILNSAIQTISSTELNLSHVTIYTFSSRNDGSGRLYSAAAAEGKTDFWTEKVPDTDKMFPWLKDYPEDGRVFWTEPYVSPNSPNKKTVVTCGVFFKFHGEGKISGMAAIAIDLQNIKQYINDAELHEHGKVLLLSRSGLYVMHPDPDVELKKTIFEFAEEQDMPQLAVMGHNVLNGESGDVQMPYSSIFFKPTVFFYAPISQLNWGFFLGFAEDELFKPVHEMQNMIVFSGFIGLLILFGLINVICRRSVEPLERLTKIALQYGRGDFSAAVPAIASGDEIGKLSQAFDNMRTNLLTYIDREKREAAAKQRDLSELAMARNIQHSALPVNFPQHEAFEVFAMMDPARQVGGDFYDFFFLNKNKFAVVIADVSGKGFPAALYMMRVQEIIRHMAQYVGSVAEIFTHVNNLLCEGNDACMFVSAFLAVVDTDSGETEYVNAGHTPPFLIENGKCRKITPPVNMVLGAREGFNFVSEKINLSAGSSLFLYTDGVTEAENNRSLFYGEERLFKVLQNSPMIPSAMIDAVMQDIRGFTEGEPQSDDITMLSLLYRGRNSDVLETDADVGKIAEVLDFIEQKMVQKGVGAEVRSQMIVIAEEIYSNIAQYAYEDSGWVRIETACENGRFCLMFIDGGKPYNPLEQADPDIDLPVDKRQIGGLGIYIVKKMADLLDYSYQDGKNILKIEMNIQKTLE